LNRRHQANSLMPPARTIGGLAVSHQLMPPGSMKVGNENLVMSQ
jgi:hypothetical protein